MSTEIDTTKILENLGESDWQIRERAIMDYCGYKGEEYSSFLTEHIHDPNINVRNAVKTILIKRGEAFPLYKFLDSNDRHIRIAVINIIGQIPDKQTPEKLINLFKSESDATVRLSIIEALRIFKDPDVSNQLLPLLSQVADEEKLLLILLLKDFECRLPGFIDFLFENVRNPLLRDCIIETFCSMRLKEAIPYLLFEIIENRNMNPDFSLKALSDILENNKDAVRMAQKEFLKVYKNNANEIITFLVEEYGLERKYYHEVSNIVLSLNEEVLPFQLIKLLPFNREELLARLSSRYHSCKADITEMIKSLDPSIKALAIQVIAREGDQEATEWLIGKLLIEKDSGALHSFFLGLYHKVEYVITEKFMSLAFLILRDQSWLSVVSNLNACIVKFGKSISKEKLLDYLKSERILAPLIIKIFINNDIKVGIGFISELALTADEELLKLIITYSSLLNEDEAMPLLKRYMSSNNPSIRKNVINSLSKMKGDESLRLLETLYNDTDNEIIADIVLAIAKRHDLTFISEWINKLKSPMDHISFAIIKALHDLGITWDNKEISMYIDRLNDDDRQKINELMNEKH